MSDKTKAALQSCQCHYEIFKQSQDITLIVAVNYRAKFCAQWVIVILVDNSLFSWQSVKLRFAPNPLIIPDLLTLRADAGEISSAKYLADVVPQSVSTMHFCILGFSPMVHPSLYRYVSRCEENRISLLMKFSKALESASKQNQQVKFTQLNIEGADSIQDFGSSFAFLRWRRLISLSKAATTNCPVLSPGSFHCSIESAMSCGTLAAIVCDFPLTALVAMFVHSIKGVQQYGRNKKSVQHLTCSTPYLKLVLNTLCFQYTNTAKPGSVTSTNRASNHNVRWSNIMACIQHTQTRPKYQYRFLALNRHDKKAKPCRLSVEAATEREARSILAPHFILSLAARLPVQEVRHV